MQDKKNVNIKLLIELMSEHTEGFCKTIDNKLYSLITNSQLIRIIQGMQETTQCLWITDEGDFCNSYETDCGNYFDINDDKNLSETGMEYCPFCSRSIKTTK